MIIQKVISGGQTGADIVALQQALDELRRGVYELWKPQELVKLQDSPVT